MTPLVQEAQPVDTGVGRIRAGDTFPLALLRDAHGRRLPVVDGPTVVLFHHGAGSPSCQDALAASRSQLLPALAERGVRLVAVSTRQPTGSADVARADALGFPALTDAGGQLVRVLGLDADGGPGEDGWTLSRPAVVVVDDDHVVTLVDLRTGRTPSERTAAVLGAVSGRGRAARHCR